jgi:hypothetical protein
MSLCTLLWMVNTLVFASYTSRETIVTVGMANVAVVSIFFVFNQISLLQKVCQLLHLPFIFRVVRATGLEEDETQVYQYDPSPYNPFRFDVEVNIDGMITHVIKRG